MSMWRGLRVRISHSVGQESTTSSVNVPAIFDDVPVEDFQCLFQALGVENEPSDTVSWLDSDIGDSGVQTYTTMKFVNWYLSQMVKLNRKTKRTGMKKNRVQ